jgi:hypothetical protein
LDDPPPSRITVPYDVAPLDAIGPPVTLGALRANRDDRCEHLEPLPGVTQCLPLDITPANSTDGCVQVSVDQPDQRGVPPRLRRDTHIKVVVDCSNVDNEVAGGG